MVFSTSVEVEISVGGILVLVSFFLILAPLIYVVLRYTITMRKAEDTLSSFTSVIRFYRDRLVMPMGITIDIGLVRITGLSYRADGYKYQYDIRVVDPQRVTTSVIDLSRLCSSQFYIYASWDGDIYIETPGFVVRYPKEFENIIALCVDPSKIPERSTEIVIEDPPNVVKALVSLSPKGIEASLAWFVSTLKQSDAVYNKKLKLYRVITAKSRRKLRAKSARLEICFQGPEPKRVCYTFVKVQTPDSIARNSIGYKASTPLVFIHENVVKNQELASFLAEVVSSQIMPMPIVIGYRKGFISARLVLVKSHRKSLVKEVDL